MDTIDDVYSKFKSGNIPFSSKEETDIFHDALVSYIEGKHVISASLSAILYERIFITRLINETANPTGFIPSKDNIQEQLDNLLERKEEVENIDRLLFRQVTKKLLELSIVSENEKNEYDDCKGFT